MKLEGRLVGPWATELQQFWETIRGSEKHGNFRVNLKGVTSIDERGKALLRQIHQQGGIFIAPGCWTNAIVEEVTAFTTCVGRNKEHQIRFADGSGQEVS